MAKLEITIPDELLAHVGAKHNWTKETGDPNRLAKHRETVKLVESLRSRAVEFASQTNVAEALTAEANSIDPGEYVPDTLEEFVTCQVQKILARHAVGYVQEQFGVQAKEALRTNEDYKHAFE